MPTSKHKDLFPGGRPPPGFSKPIMPAMRINLVPIRLGQTTVRNLQQFLPRMGLRERFYHLTWDFDPSSALASSYRCVTSGSISFWAASDPNSALGSEAKAGPRRVGAQPGLPTDVGALSMVWISNVI